jgi:hypothetical protein
LLDDRRIWIRIHTSDYRIRIQEAQKRMDPTDPDPQNCIDHREKKVFKNRAVTAEGGREAAIFFKLFPLSILL